MLYVLHPNVPTHDQITSWLTPFSINHLNSLTTTLLPHLIQGHSLITRSIVPGTAPNNYAASLLCFTQLCDEHHIPESLHMPASEDILTLFVATKGAHKVSAITIKHWTVAKSQSRG